MPSTLVKIFILLAFTILAIARPQSNAPADTTSRGNYRITSCGTRVPAVKSLLDSTYLWIKSANLSTKSPAYDAFFGNLNPEYVANVFEYITSGVDVDGDPPTLVCVNEADAHADANIRSFWKECQTNPRVYAISPRNSAKILLCPRFFDLHLWPQPRGCGTVNHANTQFIPTEGTTRWMLGTQYGVLIEALANLYIPLATTQRPLLFDLIEVNQCLKLRPDDAKLNPGSYAYLASTIRAGCTHFPSRRPERELIEVKGDALNNSDGTKLVTLGCSGSEANSSSCSG